jgi:hypothetical protein
MRREVKRLLQYAELTEGIKPFDNEATP